MEESHKHYSKNHSKGSRSRSNSKEKQKFKKIKQNKYKLVNEQFNYKSKENPRFKISSGPLEFKGSEGAKLEKRIEQINNKIKQLEQQSQNQFKSGQQKQSKSEHDPSTKSQFIEEEYKAIEWERYENEADIYWYDNDEGGLYFEDREQNLFVGDHKKYKEMEEEMENLNQQRQIKRRAQENSENNKWEFNRMMHSGLFRLKDTLMDDEEENRVILNVHDFKPPFLDGKQIYSKQIDPISIVKDPKCDMVVLSKKGSALIKKQRELKERKIQKDKFLTLQGTKLGDILHVKRDAEEDPDQVIFKENGEVDYKAANKFSDLMKKKQEAASDFAKSKSIKEQREFLPIFGYRTELMQLISQNKILVVVGDTGSGKTTQIPQYLHEEGYSKYGMVGCTQPRRVAAVSVAKRVSEEMGVKLGDDVGYSIRFEDCTSAKTLIKYMTDGVLLRESLNDAELDQYSCLVMDEAHERSLNTDVLLGLLKSLTQKRRDLKVLITSATMNAEKFSDFFDGAPIYRIPGRAFPVKVQHSLAPSNDYVLDAVKKTMEIHLNQDEGDILIFMTGQEDIEVTCAIIEERLEQLEKSVPKMLILPIYSQLRSEEQAKIFEKSKLRKCIVATNIAETSLTLDGVKYVIDTGYCKQKVYNPRIGMDVLQMIPISQANADQRSGRAGRTGPGVCYRLYGANNFRQDMLENNIPEIQRTNLANVVLLLKTLKIDNLLEFEFVDPPPQETILNSMYQLWLLGCLDELGRITDAGKTMAQFPLDPPLGKMLVISNQLECTEEILTIVSMLSIPSIFFRPKNKESESDAAREKLVVPESDHLTLLNIYEQWKKHDYSADWCSQHYVQVKSMRKVREVRSQLKDICEKLGFKVKSCNYTYDIVRKVITSAYFTNAARIKSIGEYINLRTGLPCKVHPSSALFSLGYTPDYVVYHDLIMTTKEYMHCVTTVDPYWLQEMGPMFFSVQELGVTKDRLEQKKMGYQIMERKIEEAKQQQLVIDQAKMQKQQEDNLKRQEKEADAMKNQSRFGAKPQFTKRKIIQFSNDARKNKDSDSM